MTGRLGNLIYLTNNSAVSVLDLIMLPSKLAFIDTETTGGSLRTDRVIEIGILRVENGKLVTKFTSLVNPQRYLPPEIELLTNINAGMVETAPTFFDLKDQILELLEGCVFVAHNARFDYGFIKTEFKRYNINFSSKHLCTVRLSRALYPEHRHHNLDSIIERHNFKIKSRHRAFDDAEVLWKFYKKTQSEFNPDQFLTALNRAQKRPTLPMYLTEEQIDALPESPGVYIFYGESGAPLYVGKSINLRDRVLSHFASDHTSSTEMKISQQIRQVETIETEGELGALLKEAYLIKKLQPLYNRKLREKRQLIVLKYHQNQDGYYTTTSTVQNSIDPNELDSIVGVFKNKRSVSQFLIHVAKEYELCEKLLGIDHTTSACFGYRLNRCKGACKAKEKPLFYNFRFMEAVIKMKFKKWPFEHPVIIDDYNADGSSCDSFIINNWCVIGTVTNDGQKIDTNQDINFDLDTYKILASYLGKPQHFKKIRLYKPTPDYPSLLDSQN